MPNRMLLAAAEKDSIRRFITGHSFTRAVADRFVAGDTLDEAVTAMSALGSQGIGAILDYLGENVTTSEQADDAAQRYLDCLDVAPARGAHVSVKLTQLGLDLSQQGCIERMRSLCERAERAGTFVAIDMESHVYTDKTLEVYEQLRQKHDRLVLCLQAYLKRTQKDIARLLPLEPSIRLCKGAYNEPKELAFRRGKTRDAFMRSLRQLIEGGAYVAIATHDQKLIDFSLELMGGIGASDRRYEFQMLYGVRPGLQEQLVAEGHQVRVYIPFGDQWYPYLMRRLAERPANLRFFLEAMLRKS